MGEVIELGGVGVEGGFGLLPALFSLVALGIYALLTSETGNNNDDDDSSPGGGLMQPVA
jgi:hypothetical protein